MSGGFDPGVGAYGYAAWCQAYLGRADRALALSNQAVTLAQRADHPLSVAFAGLIQADVHAAA